MIIDTWYIHVDFERVTTALRNKGCHPQFELVGVLEFFYLYIIPVTPAQSNGHHQEEPTWRYHRHMPYIICSAAYGKGYFVALTHFPQVNNRLFRPTYY